MGTLRKGGYPDSAVTTGKHRAQEIDRETALQTSHNEGTNRMPFTLSIHITLQSKMSFSKASKFSAMIPKHIFPLTPLIFPNTTYFVQTQ